MEAAVVEWIAIGFVHHRSRFQDLVGTVLSTKLPTDYQHNSIIELSVCWCV